MKEYELRITVSYKPNQTIFYNCFKEFIKANNKNEAKRIVKEKYKDYGYRTMKITEIYEA